MHRSPIDLQLQKTAWALHGGGALTVVLIVLATLLLGVHPLQRQQAKLTSRAELLSTALNTEDSVQQQFDQLAAERREADVKIQQLLERIPNVPRESDFLGQVTTLAGDVGLSIVDYRPGSATAHSGYKQMTLTLSSDGDYESVCRFLHSLQSLPRLNRVVTLDITPVATRNEFKMTMTLTIFFAPESHLQSGQENKINV